MESPIGRKSYPQNLRLSNYSSEAQVLCIGNGVSKSTKRTISKQWSNPCIKEISNYTVGLTVIIGIQSPVPSHFLLQEGSGVDAGGELTRNEEELFFICIGSGTRV
jgi:hypothetical protein